MKELIERLHQCGCSCVIENDGDVRVFHKRGVADLYELLEGDPDFLFGARIADKVVGKGAAALMVKGRAARVYADVISRPAAELLAKHDIPFCYDKLVDQIQNRNKTGWCPVETLCIPFTDIDEMLLAISKFVKSMK